MKPFLLVIGLLGLHSPLVRAQEGESAASSPRAVPPRGGISAEEIIRSEEDAAKLDRMDESAGSSARDQIINSADEDQPAAEEGKAEPQKAWRPPRQKSFTPKQKQAECNRYEGKFVSYYEHIYKVESCKRREIVDHDLLQRMVKGKQPIHNIGNDTIIMLGEGKPYTLSDFAKKRSCKELDGHYITRTASDAIYFVEKCVKRPFPDYETFESHRDGRNKKAPILEVSDAEFSAIKTGRSLVSILDKQFKELTEGSAGVDVIPVDEACRGVNNQFVAYYSRLYRIENCRKREIEDTERFMAKHTKLKLKELTSEQWLSLPDGRAYKF